MLGTGENTSQLCCAHSVEAQGCVGRDSNVMKKKQVDTGWKQLNMILQKKYQKKLSRLNL